MSSAFIRRERRKRSRLAGEMRGRLFGAALVVNALLSLTALGWLTWITLEPHDWFPDAFAEKGETGDQGPQGRVARAVQFVRKAQLARLQRNRQRPFHDLRHTALTNEAAAGSSPIALMAKAGHSDMKTARIHLHLAGTVFPEEAAALERRLLGGTEPDDHPVLVVEPTRATQ